MGIIVGIIGIILACLFFLAMMGAVIAIIIGCIDKVFGTNLAGYPKTAKEKEKE